MKIALITNLRAPYRTLQLNEFSKIRNCNFNVYYTNKPFENREWNVNTAEGYNETDLFGIKISKKGIYINSGLIKIVVSNDLLILGGYESPTYLMLSILCKVFRKKYILLFDGISTNRINTKESKFKKIIKGFIINNSSFIFGNGEVSKKYFSKNFFYPEERIFNQYLSVDNNLINNLYIDRDLYRKEYRKKLGIDTQAKVLVYSGRLIDIKNVENVIRAISKIKEKNILFLIIGGGPLENYLQERAKELEVNIKITGFLSEQSEVFKHYFVGDALILPSIVEPWGLVVNEALAAGLPVIVSKNCGCSLDLVKQNQNGYLIDPYNVEEISTYINKLLFVDNTDIFSEKSRKIIKEWSFENSRISLERIINLINISYKKSTT